MEKKLLRVRDVREELSRRLGYVVTTSQYRYWQRVGLVPGPLPKEQRYKPLYRQDEVDIMLAKISSYTQQKGKGDFSYRIPGVWRRREIIEEIRRRLKVENFDRVHFEYCRQLGIIPEPSVPIPSTRNPGKENQRNGWSDAQLEEIIAMVGSHVKKEPQDFTPGV